MAVNFENDQKNWNKRWKNREQISSKIVTRPKKEPQHSEIREKKRREIVNIMKKIGMPWT